MKTLLALIASASLSAVSLGLAAAPAAAQMVQDQGGTHTIIVPKDKSAAFRLDYPASEIVVAQPDTLELVATTDRSFYVRGKALGVTNILIYDQNHRLAQVVDVRVGYDTESLQADLAAALPGERITASNFAGGILLSGEASTSGAALRAAAIAERYAPKSVQSAVSVRAAQQVMVEVRIIEASRTALKDLGIDLDVQNISGFRLGTGNRGLINSNFPEQAHVGIGTNIGTTSIDLTLRALETKGVIHTLARPNLIAMSGEEANFLAGGEFPFPVPNGNNGVTIEFRTFGVKLNMTPVVEDNGQIRLKIAPEVSQLDPRHGVRIQGFDVPAITTRRASTAVELRDGQSFAIAGLFEKTMVRSVNQVPWAGDVPILGALFKSTDWQKNQTELVIIVTPRLTTPVDDVNRLPNPLRDADEPSAIDQILMNHGYETPHGAPNSMTQEPVAQNATPAPDAMAAAPAVAVPLTPEPVSNSTAAPDGAPVSTSQAEPPPAQTDVAAASAPVIP